MHACVAPRSPTKPEWIWCKHQQPHRLGVQVKFVAFSFENFKGMHSASVQLLPTDAEGTVVTLVGLNESGKTTVLEAIDRFYPGREDEEIKPKDLLGVAKQDPFDFIPISARGNFNESVKIIATVRLDAEDKQKITEGVSDATGFRVRALPDEIEITNRYTFSNSKLTESKALWPTSLGEGTTRQGKIVHLITASKRRGDWLAVIEEVRKLVPRIWYFPNFLFEFPESVQLNESLAETDINRLFRYLLQDIIASIDPTANLDEHVVQRALSQVPSDKSSLNQMRLMIGAEVTSTVVAQWNAMFGGTEMQGKRIFFEIDPNSPEVGSVSGRFLLEDGSEMFSIRERSLGFRWFFVFLLLTTYRARRSEQGGIVYLLDEPASNLHSSAQALLLDSLQKLGEDAQIVYTTHSHHLVNPRWLESTFVISNEAADPARITSSVLARNTDIHITRYPEFAYRNPGKQHYFQPVLDVLSYRPTELELVPEVVMTEGKADYYLLTYFTRLISDQGSNINFLPGRGAGSLDEVVRLYLGWGRNFVVLLDSDQGGRDAGKHYGRAFGRVAEDRLLSLGDLSKMPTAKGIETLLEESDRLAFQKLIDAKAARWNKRMWSQGVEHALATGTAVVLSDGAVERLSNVVASLREELASRRGGIASG